MTFFLRLFVGLLVVFVGIELALLPKKTDYVLAADEGIYLGQVNTLLTHNPIAGVRIATENYINTTTLHQKPHPLRVGYLWFCMPFVGWVGVWGLSLASIALFVGLLCASYMFATRIYSHGFALIFVVLLAFSPLYMGLCRRALADIATYTWVLLPLMAFVFYLKNPVAKNYFLFLLLLTFSGLVKESNYFFAPFYSLYLGFWAFTQKKYTLHAVFQSIITTALPALCSILLYVFLVGAHRFVTVLGILKNVEITSVWHYGAGGWYMNLINFGLLSPFVFGLFLVGIITQKKITAQTSVLIAFYIFTIIMYAFLPKNVRYVGFLDWIHCLFAASFVVNYFDKEKITPKRLLIKCLWVTLPIIALNFANFNRIFIKYRVYEPLSYYVWLGQMYVPIDSIFAAKMTIAPEKRLK